LVGCLGALRGLEGWGSRLVSRGLGSWGGY
jgi:hypothetical protein